MKPKCRQLRLICLGILTATILSSCAFTKVSIIEGTQDYIPIPKGTEITVPMDIEGGTRLYKIKTTKEGAFFSIDAQKDVLQARAK